MAEIFITLDEAAELEGVKYHTLFQRIIRNSNDYVTKTEPSANGGKDRVMVLLSCLSTKAIRAYQGKQESEIREAIDSAESKDGDEAWYVGVDYAWYLHNYKQKYFQMTALAAEIEKYLEYKEEDKTAFTEQYAMRLGMSGRNFRRKLDRYREGKRWALEMQEQDGKNYEFYRILALCPPPKKGGHVSLTEEMKATIENIWFDKKFATNLQKMTQLYSIFCDIGEKKGWLLMPSYPTVNRYINEINNKYSNEHYLAQTDMRELKRKKMQKAKRNLGMLKVMEMVQGDAHTFDSWVKITRPNGTVTAIKPYLVGLIDMRSRVLVGWAITEQPNAQVIKRCILHMIYPKKDSNIDGVPRVLLIDNGMDWTSETLTGRKRKERVNLIDAEIKGFYRGVGIEDDKRSLPYQAWTKAEIERFFGTLCSTFTNTFTSYTGTLTGSKTTSKIKKNIPKMLEKDELLSMEEFAAEFNTWLNEKYHVRTHRGLKDQKEKSPIPMDVFTTADRYSMAAPPMEYAQMLLMKGEERLVKSTGFDLFNNTYQHELLAPYVDQKIIVRYDPDNMDRVVAYSLDGIKICEVETFEGLNPLAPQGDERLTEHMKSQKRTTKMVTGNLKYLQTPYEERVEAAAGRKVILPELSGTTPQVTALPDDKQYKASVKERKQKSKNLSKGEFFERQSEKVFVALEKLEKAEGI